MNKLFRIALAIVLGLMIVHTLIYISFGIALIPFPFDYDQAEGYELNNAVLMASGGCPYCDNNVFPFYGSGYPPLFHILMIPFVHLFGAQFWYGRLIIFLSTFITAGAIAWAVYRSDNHKIVAIIAGLAFLSSNYIYHIGPLLRQHLLMVMFETLAVVTIANAFDVDKTARNRRLFAGFLFLLLAGYTKQLAISTCAAVALWVFLRNPRSAIKYSLGLAISAGFIFAILQVATEAYWWKNIITSNQNEYLMDQFVGLLRQFLKLHWMLIVLAALVIVYELYFSRLSIYTIWFIASFANTSLSGKWGAGDSYFDTLIAATCILSGIFLARSLNRTWHVSQTNYLYPIFQRFKNPYLARGTTILSLALFLLYAITVFKMPTSEQPFSQIARTFNIEPLPSWRYPLYDPAGWTVGYAVTGHLPSASDYENGWRIVEIAKNTEGLVMSEDAGFSFQSGREVITNGVQLKNLWENNLYDPSELISYIEDHQFGLIILRAHLFPPPILIAIGQNYDIDEVINMNGFDYELWKPKKPLDN